METVRCSRSRTKTLRSCCGLELEKRMLEERFAQRRGGGGSVVGKAGCCLEDEDESGVYRVTRDPAVSATVLGRKRCDGRENGTTLRAGQREMGGRE
jgi:hypothetical protein